MAAPLVTAAAGASAPLRTGKRRRLPKPRRPL